MFGIRIGVLVPPLFTDLMSPAGQDMILPKCQGVGTEYCSWVSVVGGILGS